MKESTLTKLKVVAIIVVLALGLYVAFSPTLVYAPVPRIVLFFLICLLPAILLGAEASSQFRLELRGFLFTTAGACAVFFGALVLLNYLSKPGEKIVVYQIVDEDRRPVPLNFPGALQVDVTGQAMTVTKFIDNNTLILVFPEQVSAVDISVRKDSFGPVYSGSVTYSGVKSYKLVLGKDLTTNTKP